MQNPSSLPHYDRLQTYQWNYDHAPDPVELEIPDVPGDWAFCGLPVPSPLGIPAGPLLNGKWVRYYASLGFDVLTYKTVRSTARECYPLPNLQPVTVSSMTGRESQVTLTDQMQGSWAVSFGMPSAAPETWREDIAQTRRLLPAEKILSVSVVGSLQPGWSLDDLANDYALCARWALESGADCIETNFSCPNVCTRDGQLYQQPEAAALVASRVRAAIGETPYLIKIGHLTQENVARTFLEAVTPYASGIVMTNSVATTVTDADGTLLFNGEQRGICGSATREASLHQLQLFRRLLSELPPDSNQTQLISCGGISSVQDVRQFLEAGAQATHLATAAMCDPLIACQIRAELAKEPL
ncbi:NAD-dependent dihydropyrimidine dehydrogenase subunit PreA [Gimesia panareensis]|uniref:NAD-dependent dihydropyrimidine dehydrogenase subunit PreA n=1 Tax=Gimesia panareensis TaxID=2527978 RepID=A0A517Q311_9PLAN|nr:hypothetical protein [Gimesia panareensis]QDT26009.1 NAD-dependent dihydropyrimidine dehydrogenase subunit PreA [Gimesia panareensis]